MAQSRARSHSPSALACGSRRVDDATPSPEQAVDHDVDAAEVGQRVDLDVEVGRLGQQLAHASRRRGSRPARRTRRRGAGGRPGSRRRRWRRRPCRRTGRARAARAARGRSVADPVLGCDSSDASTPPRVELEIGGRPSAAAMSSRRAVGEHDDVRHLGLRHVAGAVDAERGAGRRRPRDAEAGVGRQRELDRRVAERAADRLGLGATSTWQRSSDVPGASVAGSATSVRSSVPLDGVGPGAGRRTRASICGSTQRGLLVDVEPGEQELDAVAEAAERS